MQHQWRGSVVRHGDESCSRINHVYSVESLLSAIYKGQISKKIETLKVKKLHSRIVYRPALVRRVDTISVVDTIALSQSTIFLKFL